MDRKSFSSLKIFFKKKNILFTCLDELFLLLSVFFGYAFFPLFKKGNYTLGAVFISAFLVSLALLTTFTIITMKKYDYDTKKADFDTGRFIFMFGSITLTGIVFTIFALIMSKFNSNNSFFIPGTAGIGFVFMVFCIFAGLTYLNTLFEKNNENSSN